MAKTKAKRRVKRAPYGNRTPLLANGLSYRVTARNEDGSFGQCEIPVSEMWRALHGAVSLMRRHGLDAFEPKELWAVLLVACGEKEASRMVRAGSVR